MPRAGLDTTAVVEAATALVDADGLGALTLARLAARLNIRTPSLYAHVDGLGDLRSRLAVAGAREMWGALARAAAGRSGADALWAVAVAYRTFAHDHPGLYGALQRAPDPDDAELAAAATGIVDVIVAVMRGYGLEGDDAIHAVRMVRSALHGFVALEAEGGFAIPLSLDETWERLIELLDRGLASTP